MGNGRESCALHASGRGVDWSGAAASHSLTAQPLAPPSAIFGSEPSRFVRTNPPLLRPVPLTLGIPQMYSYFDLIEDENTLGLRS